MQETKKKFFLFPFTVYNFFQSQDQHNGTVYTCRYPALTHWNNCIQTIIENIHFCVYFMVFELCRAWKFVHGAKVAETQ